MIKVGQIWKNDNNIFCITCIYGSAVGLYYNIIDKNGFVAEYLYKEFDNENYVLLKEYPTWQEAVNSKEFKK